jgi:hypothetical protein
MPVNPNEVLRTVAEGTPDEVGERLVRAFLAVWDSPAGSAGAALLRTAVSSELGARMLREFVTRQILRRIVQYAGMADDPRAELRATLVGTQLIGLAMARYIVRIEPIASTPRETLITTVAPTLQRYLTGDIGLDPPAG